MKSVAIVSASARYDGISFDSLQLYGALSRLGYGVRWYQCVDRGQEPFLPDKSIVVKGSRVPWAALGMGLNRAWVFPRYLRDIPEDILVLSDPTLIRAGRGHHPVVGRVHDLRPLSVYSDRLVTRLAFKYAVPRLKAFSRIIVATDAVGMSLLKYGIHPEALRTIPEVTNFGYHPEHVEASIRRISQSREIRVLCVSTDRPFKNLSLLFNLAASTVKRREKPTFRFTLVSRLRPETQRQLRESSITTLSVVSDIPDLGELYRSHDVLVFPSLCEGFGRPLIEAMSFGMPILAYRTAPVAEVLGGAGILLDSRVNSWLTALESLGNPDSFRELALKTLSRSKRFSPENFLSAVADAFDGL